MVASIAQKAFLSAAQQRLWLLNQLEDANAAVTHNLFNGWYLTGPLDINALEQSFSEIVRRHESLRTTFVRNQSTVFVDTYAVITDGGSAQCGDSVIISAIFTPIIE